MVAGSNGLVGYALDALRQACFGAHSGRLVLLDYETLTRAPEGAIGALYKLLGPAPFAQDSEPIANEAAAFDTALGWPGLHAGGAGSSGARARQCCHPTCSSALRATAFGSGPNRGSTIPKS